MVTTEERITMRAICEDTQANDRVSIPPAVVLRTLDALDAADARIATLAAEVARLRGAIREWREADADESGTLKASLRRDEAYVQLIDIADEAATQPAAEAGVTTG